LHTRISGKFGYGSYDEKCRVNKQQNTEKYAAFGITWLYRAKEKLFIKNPTSREVLF